MIQTIADLLREIVAFERRQIDAQGIKHAPTIGEMYEGLTRTILSHAIPKAADLRVVNGFVTGEGGRISRQIDCMIVHGSGHQLPHSTASVWPIANVIATVEVKKTLYREELSDSLDKAAEIADLSLERFERRLLRNENLPLPIEAFSIIAGIRTETSEAVQTLSRANQALMMQLCAELHSPIRAVFGYRGYSAEYSLRRAAGEVLVEKSMGPYHLPQLVSVGDSSLLKLSGIPFGAAVQDDWWHLWASTNENPLRLLIELVWTKLASIYKFDWYDDRLEVLSPSPFRRARFDEARQAWALLIEELDRGSLQTRRSQRWSPQTISLQEQVVLLMLMEKGSGSLDQGWLQEIPDAVTLIQSLIEKRLLSWTNQLRRTVTLRTQDSLVFLISPDGSIVVADADDERMGQWTLEKIAGSAG